MPSRLTHRRTFRFASLPVAAVVALTLAACSEKPTETPVSVAPPPPPPVSVQKPELPVTPPPAVEAKKKNVDAELAASVKKALEGDKELAGQGIEVTSSAGKVNLWGTVGTESDRERAARVAAGVTGVTTVENKLVVVRGS